MKKKVFFVCTGLGHIRRGYESFTEECFDALKDTNVFDLYLLKGGGERKQREILVPCIKRKSKFAKVLSHITKKETYWLEQLSFLFGMIPSIMKHKPVVIYYSDFILGTWLWQLRRFMGFKYKLLFSNGAPNGPPFKRMDHVQQLLNVYYNDALANGAEESIQTVLPYGFCIDRDEIEFNISQKNKLREELNLPKNKKIIISIGAVNSVHKRMDYLIKEFALLNQEEYFLIILGSIDKESKQVLNIAAKKIPENNYLIKEVPFKEVPLYLSVSDYFILPSLKEGFGRVLIEALNAGLSPIVHDTAISREVLEKNGIYKNLTSEKKLIEAIADIENGDIDKSKLKEFAYKKYSWHVLKDDYIKMIQSQFINEA